MAETPERSWLPEARPAPRRGVLEDTLFRRLEDLRRKPPADLVELVERTLEVLRATKEALLEQRQEIRSLAASVDILRTRVDRLAHRPEPEPLPTPPAAPSFEAPPFEAQSVEAPPVEAPPEQASGPHEHEPPPADAPGRERLLLLGLASGYRLVAWSGGAPEPRERLAYDGVVFEVVGEKGSALPGDTRRVVFALPVGPPERPSEATIE